MNCFDANEQSAGSNIIDVWQIEPSGETVSASHRGVISKVQKLDRTTKPRSPEKAERYCACCQEGIKMSFREANMSFLTKMLSSLCLNTQLQLRKLWCQNSQSSWLFTQKQILHIHVKHTHTSILTWTPYIHVRPIYMLAQARTSYICVNTDTGITRTHQSARICQTCLHVMQTWAPYM